MAVTSRFTRAARSGVAATVGRVAGQRADDGVPIEDLVEGLEEQVARRLLGNAAEWHEDVIGRSGWRLPMSASGSPC